MQQVTAVIQPAAAPNNKAANGKIGAVQARAARMVAIKKVAVRARTVCLNSTNDADLVPSPCISLCRVDAHTHWCDGCFRTLDEISQWSRLDAVGKLCVWQAIGQRAGQASAALAAEPP